MIPIRGRLSATVSILAASLLLAACNPFGGQRQSGGGQAGGQAAGGPPGMPGRGGATKVGVITVHPRDVPITETLPGRTTASAVAEVRPQVSGIIKKRVFTEGALVKAGDVLYEIDDRLYQAAFDSAKADVEKADAAIPNAQAKVNRYNELADAKGVSRQDLDDARATLAQARAGALAVRAALQTAQINLDNTRLRAAISGPIGTSTVTEGALVTANQTTALATIRQIDPIYVDMTVSSAVMLRIRKMVDRAKLATGDGPGVTLTLDDGTPYVSPGRLISTEANVDEGTSSVTMRASFTNPDRLLLPGMYVRATVELGKDTNVFLLPQRAVGRNSKGQATVVVVGADNKSELRLIEPERAWGNFWVVRNGIDDGDKVVVDGTQNVRGSGQPVAPVAVELDDKGLTKEIAPAGAGEPADKPAQ